MMIAWERPWLLVFALLIAALGAGAASAWQRRRSRRLAALGSEVALERLAPAAKSTAGLRRAIRLGVASVLASIAFAGPRWGTAREVIRTKGGDVVLAMDASLSMLADDERPTRLERMKQEVRRFRAASPGDRVGLIAFAGRAYVLSPLTADDGALELFLDNLDPSIVGQPGTALAPAINGALDLLESAQGGAGKAIVLLSDGEGFDDRAEAIKAAQRARRQNVRLVAVGFGTEGGTSIPVRMGSGVEAKRDEHGDVVITRYSPETLSEIARVAEGEFIAASSTDKGTRIARALASLEAKRRAAEAGLAMPARYQWLLGLAVLLLLFDAWYADGGRVSARVVRFFLRRRVGLAALFAAATVLSPSAARSQSWSDRGVAEFKAGRTGEAIKWFKEAVGRGERTPRTLYNYGTVLLAADSLDAAIDALERAGFGATPALRDRALYNLGLAQLLRARKSEGDDRVQSARAALAAYRTLLLAHPTDADARWNYELALKLRQSPPPQSGAGGEREQQRQLAQQRDPSGMSQQQAQQLLDAAARDERDTQSRRRRVPQRERPPGGKDW